MTPALATKVSRILPLLGSDRDGEVLAAVAALRRTLSTARLDLNDLAAELLHPAPAVVVPAHHARRPRRERTPRTAPLSPEVLQLLRAGLALDAFTSWERRFAETVLNAAGRRTWRPTPKQHDIIARLANKAGEAEAHP